ncbi:MAG: GNAT family N-acetyltransferase [Alphaproteobacteria bacterium]|jgi:predicted N-acetyltransferase YhbS|nr:GNAT family N-acetyltransferase [Alphaproteobacteria bacterium]
MQVRTSKTEDEIAAAAQIDVRATSTCSRAQYIATVAEVGGLKLAFEQGQIVGFCCVDNRFFFEKVFISLLIVDPDSRRRGVGQELIQAVALDHPELWTSTNRSNAKNARLDGQTGLAVLWRDRGIGCR